MKENLLRFTFLPLLFFLIASVAFSQNITWQRTLGGTRMDEGYGIAAHPDGGYVIAGVAGSSDGDVSGIHLPTPPALPTDAWVVKVSATGSLEWQKCLGGTEYEAGLAIAVYADGTSLMAGHAVSTDGDVTGNHGGGDAWLVKLSETGDTLWQKCLGGTGSDIFYSVATTADGGAILAGSSNSTNGQVSGNHGDHDVWLVKVSAAGNLEWQKSLGGQGSDIALSVALGLGGGYILTGVTESSDGDVSGQHGAKDMWVVKVDDAGSIEWQKCLGGTHNDNGAAVIAAGTGGYLVAGYAVSNNGDVSGNNGAEDAWIVKLDSSGTLEWQRCYGTANYDRAHSIQNTLNGEFIFTGYTNYQLANIAPDLSLVQCYPSGDIHWQEQYGGSSTDAGYSLVALADGSCAVIGNTSSSDGDVIGLHGVSNDGWVLKIGNTWIGTEAAASLGDIRLFPNPASGDELQLSYSLSHAALIESDITDLSGKVLMQQSIKASAAGAQETRLDISTLPAGFYFLRLQTEGNAQTLKWVKANSHD